MHACAYVHIYALCVCVCVCKDVLASSTFMTVVWNYESLNVMENSYLTHRNTYIVYFSDKQLIITPLWILYNNNYTNNNLPDWHFVYWMVIFLLWCPQVLPGCPLMVEVIYQSGRSVAAWCLLQQTITLQRMMWVNLLSLYHVWEILESEPLSFLGTFRKWFW